MQIGRIVKGSMKAIMAVIVAVIVLFALCVALIYFPPFQRFAVNKVCENLSEEMGMEISVGDVLLKWPLNLTLWDVKVAPQEPTPNPKDSLRENSSGEINLSSFASISTFSAFALKGGESKSLTLSGSPVIGREQSLGEDLGEASSYLSVGVIGADVKLLPLFDGVVDVDSVRVGKLNADTKDLIDALILAGKVDTMTVDGARWNMNDGGMTVRDALLRGGDLDVVIGESKDSVEEEEGESPLKLIDLNRIRVESLKARLKVNGQGSTVNSQQSTDNEVSLMSIDASLRSASLGALLDLEKGDYRFKNLDIDNLACRYDSPDFSCNVDSCSLKSDEIRMNGSEVTSKYVAMNVNGAGEAVVRNLKYNGQQSTVNGQQLLPSSTSLPDISGDVSLRVTDVNALTKILPKEMTEMLDLPDGSSADAECRLGNNSCTVSSAKVNLPGTASMEVEGFDYDLVSGNMSGHIEAKVQDAARLKKMLPKEVSSMINVPKGMALSADFAMTDGKVNVDDVVMTTPQGTKVEVGKAFYDMESEEYDIDLDVRKLVVNQFVSLSERTCLSGHIKAKGRGFDFLSPKSYTNASVNLTDASYGQYSITNTDMDVALAHSALDAKVVMDDRNIIGNVSYNGTLSKKEVGGQVLMDIRKADLYAAKVVESPMNISLLGVMNVDLWQGKKSRGSLNNLKADAGIMGLSYETAEDTIMVEEFVLYANSTDDYTELNMASGDLDIDMKSPLGYEKLLNQYVKVGDVAMQQLKDMKLDVNMLKEYMPEATFSAHLGEYNPVAQVMNMNGIAYEKIDIDVATSNEIGVSCNADIYGLEMESLRLDTIVLDVFEEGENIKVGGKVTYPEQNGIRPFTAAVNGFVAPKETQMRLFYFDEHGDKGVDFGLRAQVADSLLCMDVYPYNPIIGYKQFEVADTNYVNLHKRNRIFADVKMVSVDDSCLVHLSADPADDELQMINLDIRNLNMEPLIAVMPFAPKMTGMMNGDISFIQKMDTTITVAGDLLVDEFVYESTRIGDVQSLLKYTPKNDGGHVVKASLICNDNEVADIDGEYAEELDANVHLTSLPLDLLSAFMEDLPVAFSGGIGGNLSAKGPIEKLVINGYVTPEDARVYSKIYSLDFSIANDTVFVDNSKISFDQMKVYAAGNNPITIRGNVDFSNFDNVNFDVNVTGRRVEIVNAPATRQSELFGKVNGDLRIRLRGNSSNMNVSGTVTILNTSDVTYVMTNTALSMGYRLDDIVTFVDFSLPPDSSKIVPKTFVGLDMNLRLTVEDGAKVMCMFSADGKSYVDVQGGGTLTMVNNSEGVTQLTGRYTINSGEMKYANSVIPLKTFTLHQGSYIEFTGDPMNPTLNLAATERERASVSNSDGSTRMVTFNTGLKITQTLQNLGLEFTIDAPEDLNVQNELAGMTAEEKNKLALTMLATGMYATNSNAGSFNTTNALNNFLQGEINNIAGKALNSVLKMDMNLGVEETVGNDGASHTDYSFKFSKRLFSDRLNVVVGGAINTGSNVSNSSRGGTYIDDVSLEWRLDKSGTQYIRLFHDKDYNNLLEGELTENGGGMVLRKKMNKWSELWKLFQFKKSRTSVVNGGQGMAQRREVITESSEKKEANETK